MRNPKTQGLKTLFYFVHNLVDQEFMKDSPVQFAFASIIISWSNQPYPEDSPPRWLTHTVGKFVLTQLGAPPGLLAAGGEGDLGCFLYGFFIGLLGLPLEMESGF